MNALSPSDLWPLAALLAVSALLFPAGAGLAFACALGMRPAASDPVAGRMAARLARQMLRLVSGLAWLFAGGAAAAFFVAPEGSPFLVRPFVLPVIAFGIALAHGAVASTVLGAAWRPEASPARLRTGLFGVGVALLVAVACAVVLARLTLFASGGGRAALPLLTASGGHLAAAQAAAVQGAGLFWPLLATALALAGAGGGGVGLIWLLVRRQADDFGRDYYVFAARTCARRAALGAWLLLPALAWLLFALLRDFSLLPQAAAAVEAALGAVPAWLAQPVAEHLAACPELPAEAVRSLAVLLPAAGGSCLLALLAALLWTGVARSAIPLRAKPAMGAAVLCLWGSLAILGAIGSLAAAL